MAGVIGEVDAAARQRRAARANRRARRRGRATGHHGSAGTASSSSRAIELRAPWRGCGVAQVTRLPAAMIAMPREQGVALPVPSSPSTAWAQQRDGQRRHAPLLGHDAGETLGKAERAAEHADIGGQRGGERRRPAEPGHAGGIAGRHQQQRVGDAVGELVVERAEPATTCRLRSRPCRRADCTTRRSWTQARPRRSRPAGSARQDQRRRRSPRRRSTRPRSGSA